MRFDRRTRTAADIHAVDIDAYHEHLRSESPESHRRLAARALTAARLDGFTLAVNGRAWTWSIGGPDTITITPGDDGHHPRADLDADWFSDLVCDVRSTVAIMVANLPVMARGRIEHLIRFEPTLRALADGRAAWEPGAVDFVDRSGAPLDLGRRFTPDDDHAELAHFLDQAGFLAIRGMFDAEEVAALNAEADEWFARMSPNDERAWYAKVGGAEEPTCVRVTNLDPAEIRFPFAEHLSPVVALTGDPGRRYAGTDFLIKPVGVTEGISDLPWHKDCELGGHSHRCCQVVVGTSISPSGADNGRLRVLAGSHRVTMSMLDVGGVDLPLMELSTEPGDVTVHLSCVLHQATAPRHSPRRVTYSTLRLGTSDDGVDRAVKEVRDQAGRETFAPATS